MPPPLYDAHNHLQDEWLAPHFPKIVAQLSGLGLQRAVVNGTSESDWPHVLALADQYPWIVASLGLHPWHVGNRTPAWRESLVARLDAHPRAALGEIGLDRWILERARPDDPRLAGLRRAPLDEQLDVFAFQLSLAASRRLPATVHCLDAWGALDEALRRAPALPARGFLLHAYGGPAEMIETFAAHGAYFSFNGSFLDDRRARQRDAFQLIPRDRLLVETDAPAMSLPQPWRAYKLPPAPDGQTVNHPANLEAAYTGLAALLGLPLADLAARVAENFHALFGER